MTYAVLTASLVLHSPSAYTPCTDRRHPLDRNAKIEHPLSGYQLSCLMHISGTATVQQYNSTGISLASMHVGRTALLERQGRARDGAGGDEEDRYNRYELSYGCQIMRCSNVRNAMDRTGSVVER
jgi:hypothetical protein